MSIQKPGSTSRRSQFEEKSPPQSRNLVQLDDSTIDASRLPTYAKTDVRCSPVPQSTTPNPRTKADLTLFNSSQGPKRNRNFDSINTN